MPDRLVPRRAQRRVHSPSSSLPQDVSRLASTASPASPTWPAASVSADRALSLWGQLIRKIARLRAQEEPYDQ